MNPALGLLCGILLSGCMTAAGVREPVPPGGFAGFLQSRNLISGDLFLTSIELGNEVITGTGRTEVRAYKVTIN